ncbi:MAG: CPBP family intramembrane metalloprotease [Saccharofermentans sp.]|nr:CPBP family intramembrane metalloprotease [Saccharofermentans sp.]
MDKTFRPIENSKIALQKYRGWHIALLLLVGVGIWMMEQFFFTVPMIISAIFFGIRAAATGAPMSDMQAFYYSPIMEVMQYASTLSMIIMVLLIARFFDKMPMRTLGIKKEKLVIRYLIGLVTGFAIFSLAVLICHLTGALTINVDTNSNKLLIPLFFIAWMIQGFSEEILCRGWLMGSICKRYSTLTGVLVNSVFFAALHCLNSGLTPLALVNLFLFGVFASVVYLISESIWTVAAIHSIWNMVQGNFYGISVSGNPTSTTVFTSELIAGKELINGGAFGLEGGLGVTTVLLMGIIIAYILYRKNILESKII